jgi:hypothetical protein
MSQATCIPASTACWPMVSRKNVSPVPVPVAGPQTTRFSRRPIHSSVRSATWVGGRDGGQGLVPGTEGLADAEGGGGPVAASASRLELFAVGTDGQLYHIWQTAVNNGWSSWHSHGTP